MQIHEVTCDKCGISTKMKKKEIFFYFLPEGWDTMEGKDLCPKCFIKLKRLTKEFLLSKGER